MLSYHEKQLRLFTVCVVVSCRFQTKQEIAPPSHVVERYIELLCRYTPEAVYNFLKSNDSYRLEEALDVSARPGVVVPSRSNEFSPLYTGMLQSPVE